MVPVNNSQKTDQYDQKEKLSGFKQALPQILAVCVKNVLLLSLGMTLGFPTILIPSLSGSLNLICVPVGCIMSGAITQPLGRRRAMQLVNIPFLISWVLFYFANDVWQIFLALAIQGVSGGLLEAPVLIYVAEISEPHLRGILCSTSTFSVITGTLIQFLLGTFFNWRTVSLLCCTIPVLAFSLLFFVPETPIWLIAKNRYLDARKSLAWLRGWTTLEAVEEEFKEMCRHVGRVEHKRGNDNAASEKTVDVEKNNLNLMNNHLPFKQLLKLYSKKNFLWAFGLITLVFFIAQWNGTQTLTIYAVQIFATLHSPIDKYYATVILGAVNVLGCLVSVTLVHYTGKRLLNLTTLLGSGICLVITATYAHISGIKELVISKSNQTINTELIEDFNNHDWVLMTLLLVAAFLTFTGIRILPWILTGEIFSPEVRAPASGMVAALNYFFGFLVSKSFITMTDVMTLPGTFWTYGAVSIIGAVIMYFILPETEGKTLVEITEHFKGNCKIDNKVKRRQRTKTEGRYNDGFSSSGDIGGSTESRF